MRDKRIPDFFIVGAPKCGTTALQEYLCRHPDIFLPEEKELYFFGNDLTFLTKRRTVHQYLNLYDNAASLKKGDATATNLVSEEAAEEIYAFNPEAKIIIMLRNPVDMIESLHSEAVYNLNEPERNFKKALALEPGRKAGKNLPAKLTCPVQSLLYRHIATFSPQVQRYFNVFEKKQVLVILYDELKADSEAVYKKALNHLGLTFFPLPAYKKINPNKINRSESLKNLLKFMPGGLKTTSRIIIPYKPLRKKLYHELIKLNTRFVKRQSMPVKLRQELMEFFRDDIAKLEKLIEKDLSNWKN